MEKYRSRLQKALEKAFVKPSVDLNLDVEPPLDAELYPCSCKLPNCNTGHTAYSIVRKEWCLSVYEDNKNFCSNCPDPEARLWCKEIAKLAHRECMRAYTSCREKWSNCESDVAIEATTRSVEAQVPVDARVLSICDCHTYECSFYHLASNINCDIKNGRDFQRVLSGNIEGRAKNNRACRDAIKKCKEEIDPPLQNMDIDVGRLDAAIEKIRH